MSKIGILSMQRIVNYGSFLQAYALKQLIEGLGHQVEFVDYRVGEPVITDKGNSQNRLVRTASKVIETFGYHAPFRHKLAYLKYKRQFADKYMPWLGVTKEYNYTPELDCLVIGSDEVFNCIQKNSNVGYSPELFGKDNRAKRLISYAGSFGNTTMEKLKRYHKDGEIGALLSDFDAISVRDENSRNVVAQLTGRKAEVHLDPVLSYDYIKDCHRIPKLSVQEKYMILYAYSGRISDEEAEWIGDYAKRKGMKVYAFGGIQKCADRFIDCSPFEVLAYFQGAEEIITDTFHGSIFSIITHKPFTTLVRKSVGEGYGNEEKLTDLLNRLGLQARLTYRVEESEAINAAPICYEKVDECLNSYRERTKAYLKEHLG